MRLRRRWVCQWRRSCGARGRSAPLLGQLSVGPCLLEKFKQGLRRVPPDAKGGQAYKEADQEDDHRQRPCPEPAARSTHFASCAGHGAILGIVTHRGASSKVRGVPSNFQGPVHRPSSASGCHSASLRRGEVAGRSRADACGWTLEGRRGATLCRTCICALRREVLSLRQSRPRRPIETGLGESRVPPLSGALFPSPA
jgi:hypothetical protein